MDIEKHKIVFITKNLVVNGISTVIINYCKNLNNEKYDLSIICGEPIDDYYKRTLEAIDVKILVIESKRKNPVKSYIQLFNVLKRSQFDIAHVHGNSRTIAAELMICQMAGIRNRIAHCHSTSCDFLFAHRILKPVFNFLYTDAIACSSAAGKWLFGTKKFLVIPNGFEIEKFYFNPYIREKTRNELQLKSDDFLIGHIGRFIDAKNHEYMLKLAELLLQKGQNYRFVFIGEGPLLDRIKQDPISKKYRESIYFKNVTNEPEKYYSAMDLFLLPSKYEGFGIVAVEAQINGVYTLCSENVPSQVKVSNKIEFLPLDERKWMERIISISNFCYEHNDIQLAGIENYNISESVKNLDRLYGLILERNK